jgi:hypothetical protein
MGRMGIGLVVVVFLGLWHAKIRIANQRTEPPIRGLDDGVCRLETLCPRNGTRRLCGTTTRADGMMAVGRVALSPVLLGVLPLLVLVHLLLLLIHQ